MRVLLLSLAIAFALGSSASVKVDFDAPAGMVKPVNGVGQPPILGYDGYSLFYYLKEAGVPYSRLHDVGGPFGKNIYVDIPNIFRDFDADETKPENYDFAFTDLLMKALEENGVEPYFRLGVTIENAHAVRAYRIYPPKDFAKWARICEHVIRHYTEGWADGYRMKVSHWEIWNEPENGETVERNRMWKGTFEEYIRLYEIASKHLKARFPHLKIGGYASCGFYGISSSWGGNPKEKARVDYLHGCLTNFLSAAQSRQMPLDFFSFHCYDTPEHVAAQIVYCRRTLDAFGFSRTEMSLNEWFPCSGWPTLEALGSAKQAADIAAVLTVLQNGPVDDAEIYDAKATGGRFAPFFEPDTHRLRKAYYVYVMFNVLRKLGKAVPVSDVPAGIYACAATDGRGKGAIMLVNPLPTAQPIEFSAGAFKISSVQVVDETRDHERVSAWTELGPESVCLMEMER